MLPSTGRGACSSLGQPPAVLGAALKGQSCFCPAGCGLLSLLPLFLYLAAQDANLAGLLLSFVHCRLPVSVCKLMTRWEAHSPDEPSVLLLQQGSPGPLSSSKLHTVMGTVTSTVSWANRPSHSHFPKTQGWRLCVPISLNLGVC